MSAAASVPLSKLSAAVRFYEDTMPTPNSLVWVRVTQVSETSASVKLLEYGGIEGMIPYTEFTRLRIRSVGKVIKVGRQEAAQVMRMDKEKGYIDLSKKQVTRDEAKKCEESYHKARDVHSIVCCSAFECGIPLQQAMETIAYPLYKRQAGKHAYDWFKEAVTNPEVAFGPLKLSPELYDKLVQTTKHRLRTQAVKLRVDIDVTCYTSEGIDCIRDVLRIGQREGEKEPKIPLVVSIVAPPSYIIRCQTENRDEGIKKLYDAVGAMTNEMCARGGFIKTVVRPRVVGEDGEDIKVEAGEEQQPDDAEDEDEEEDK
jgi:translation initiation factor 2 subunit 1